MHELSFVTWLIHISSVIEWIFTIFVIYKISTYKEYNLFFWLSLAMVPNLIGAMCAITWHIYDNQDSHESFCSEKSINYTLLSDPDGIISDKYGSWSLHSQIEILF